MDLLSLPRPIGVDLTRIPDMNERLNLSGEKNVSCPSLDDPRASGGEAAQLRTRALSFSLEAS